MLPKQQFLLALKIAKSAHRNQIDKSGMSYIFHPMRVAVNLLHNHNNYELATIGILHDVVEDSNVTIKHLTKLGFDEKIIWAIDFLTKKKSISYDEYLENIYYYEYARLVKLEDLKDNSRIDRKLSSGVRSNKEKYLKAIEYLRRDRGNTLR